MLKLSLATLALLLTAALGAPGTAAAGTQTTLVQPDSVDQLVMKRKKPRKPKGSGCDDPEDYFEHPECR